MVIGLYFNKLRLVGNDKTVEYILERIRTAKSSCKFIERAEELEGVDVLMVLGGDGTILDLASQCALRGIKIIGVNFGHMGFLADFESSKLDEALDILLSGGYETQRRSMLEISYGGKVFYALNDLVIQRSTSGNFFANTVNLRAEIDGTTVDNFSSDGIIISTPTGSTAYSLSAGGSVLAPDLNAFILTPICAHSLHSRPIVFSDSSTLKIYQIDEKTVLNVIVDGKAADKISAAEAVTVKKSAYSVEFITASDSDFFNKLLIKLNIWSR